MSIRDCLYVFSAALLLVIAFFATCWLIAGLAHDRLSIPLLLLAFTGLLAGGWILNKWEQSC